MKIVTITSLNFIFVSGNARLITFEIRTQVAERKLENPPGELEGWRAILEMFPNEQSTAFNSNNEKRPRDTQRDMDQQIMMEILSLVLHYIITFLPLHFESIYNISFLGSCKLCFDTFAQILYNLIFSDYLGERRELAFGIVF